MKKRLAGLAAVFSATSAAALALTTGAATAAPQPIVGGSVVTNAPSWAAVIGDQSDGMWCSAALIKSNWVITAGHCSGATQVRVGSAKTNSGGTLVSTSKWVRHPSYNSGYDFGLYKLSTSVSGAPLAMATSSPAVGSSVTEYGYGQTCAPYGCGGMSPSLKSLGTKLVADSQCGGINGSWELCFDTSVTATDCYGDSGGPALVGGKLVGVTSRGASGPGESTCGNTNSIYSDTTAVQSWINSTIATR
ncbi:S1 family peptidase [Streptomyces physcomitrii]|uniref:Trypsin-like serine protease n=1 Tax=Streptomyces physcomitrii TaxID=2724184 RepID=A0ABX1HAV3_9ACTN|nr:trypsin-like serine protease [Streptomyces physcomitrii]NKI45463.1 trypsin-like serine protease [Streptomyces physcomitrii]